MTALSQPHIQHEERVQVMKATVDEAIERLATQLAAGHSEEFLQLLDFYRRFHRYSTSNVLLIRSQKPDATQVAGYRKWQSLGRQVRKGAKAIYVWAPIRHKHTEDDGQVIEAVTGFRPAAVFDASDLVDIQEHPLPSLWQPLPDDAQAVYDHCLHRVAQAGILVTEGNLPGGIQGYATEAGIVLHQGIRDSRNRLFTLLHETVHVKWHVASQEREGVSKAQKEFEAESVTYVLASLVGLEHPTARDYLLNWQATPDQLRVSIALIQRLTRALIDLLALEVLSPGLSPQEVGDGSLT